MQNFQTRIKLLLENERVLASFSDEKDLLEKFKGTPLNNDESEFIIIGNTITFNGKLFEVENISVKFENFYKGDIRIDGSSMKDLERVFLLVQIWVKYK